MEKTVTLYGNGPSTNHGCEAIVRGIDSLLDNETDLFILSADIEAGKKYWAFTPTNRRIEAIPCQKQPEKNFRFLKTWIQMKASGDYLSMDLLFTLSGIKEAAKKSKIAFSIGGDNYCYSDPQIYSRINMEFNRMGIKTVLFGCSINPDIFGQSELIEDFRRYSWIVARESITASALSKINPNTILAPDPAFFMEPMNSGQSKIWREAPCIGINLSPFMIPDSETELLILSNVKILIDWILQNTENRVVLIPHVINPASDDREVLMLVKNMFIENDRVVIAEDECAPKLKDLISHMEVFIGARTHSTIAAYSTAVPTLALGYSIKAQGIARDLFKEEAHYVLPIGRIKKCTDLLNSFLWIFENKREINRNLKELLPNYLELGRQKYNELFIKLDLDCSNKYLN